MESLISLRGVTHAYWLADAPTDPARRGVEDLNVVFEDFSLELPAGMVSLMGQNGVGKSTLLALAGARLFPAKGTVTIAGVDSAAFMDGMARPEREEARNRLVSFVHQNMEFETAEPLGAVLAAVAAANPQGQAWSGVLDGMGEALELGPILGRRLQELSKGEQQRAILAIALNYGARILMLDEPVFALEERQKAAAFAYLRRYCAATGTSLYYTAHDLDLCRDYADWTVLLRKDKGYAAGPPAEVCTQDKLEAAYQTPLATLYQKERLHRDMLARRPAGA